MESHAAELKRAISELSLETMVPRAVTQDPHVYSTTELLRLRPSADEHEEHNAPEQITGVGSGIATPAVENPRGPPPTPEVKVKLESTTPDSSSRVSPLTTVDEVQRLAEAEPSKNGRNGNGVEVLEVAKKKKKKKKSSGKNKKPAATGFEEFYADPPITPDEHEEECQLYGQGQPFHARMQTCIQRYRARRKLDEFRSKVFTKYLMLGGIEASSSKPFNGGLDEDTLQNSTAGEIAAMQATDYIRSGGSAKYYDPVDADGWVVDFEGVAKGFFSYRVEKHFPLDSQQEIQSICAVIRNFLNYVLTHAVCPEYTLDVLNARKICDRAEKELWIIKNIYRVIPGRFNIAASTLYGDYQAHSIWTIDDMEVDMFPSTRLINKDEAELVFKTSLAIMGPEEMHIRAAKGGVHIVKTEIKYLEVAEIIRPDVTRITQWITVKDYRGALGGMQPLGTIKFKAWEGPRIEEEDMTDDEGEPGPISNSIIETFWLEDEALQACFIGMKIQLKICELNIGLRFFDRVDGVFCSFFQFLHQEKMADWKEPVPNTRPAPTEDDPDAEERAMNATWDDDFKQDGNGYETKRNGTNDKEIISETPIIKDGRTLESGMNF